MSNYDAQPSSSPVGPPDPTSTPLSPIGLARERDILRVLHAAADARRARRTAARRVVLGVVAICAGAAALWLASAPPLPARQQERPITVNSPTNSPTTVPDPSPRPSAHPDPAVADSRRTPAPPQVTIVTNAVVVMGSCNAPPDPGHPEPDVCLLNDDQLLAALAETGESYGLIRRGDRVEVVRNGP